MKVTVKHINSGLTSEDKKMYNDFIKFLNKHYPVNNPLTILFLGKKSGHMSTGSQDMDGTIKVLSKNRLNRDIMRTLAHEWVHEYQHQKMGLDDTQKYQDVGGPVENMSNTLSGIFVKKFEKLNPDSHSILYGMD